MDEIQDSVCVAQRNKDNTEERVVLFLKLSNGHKLDDELMKRVKAEIRQLLSARHVPAVIMEIADIPVCNPLLHDRCECRDIYYLVEHFAITN